jgi:hypothetical protein
VRCPRCGEPLTKLERETPPDDDDGGVFVSGYDADKSERWECDNGACDLSSPCYFTVHHPFQGITSAPGDSWSISWIK